MILTGFALCAAAIWIGVLLLPWRPWGTRERLDATVRPGDADLSDVTVLVPARNEADGIRATLAALGAQGEGLHVIVVDDESVDGTAELATGALQSGPLVVSGTPTPAGWTGKLWALEQGRRRVATPFTLLLDADIVLGPGMVAALRDKMRQDRIQLVSLMAALRMQAFWEKLLMPAFVYFFKLLYPFRLSNDPAFPGIAAAAGGCIMMETQVLEEIGGFRRLKNALIDDCALAAQVKACGYTTWIGLTHSASSTRAYKSLEAIWNMVTRTAFTQLRYSTSMLLTLTGIFMLAFWLPVAGLFAPPAARTLSLLALCAMGLGYFPTLRYYRMTPWWTLALPLIGTLYLAMTWSSAARYWRGRGSEWKGRIYSKTPGSENYSGNGGA